MGIESIYQTMLQIGAVLEAVLGAVTLSSGRDFLRLFEGDLYIAWQETPYTIPLLVAAGVSAVLAFHILWRRYRVPGARTGVLLILASSEWILGYMLELGSSIMLTKIFWNKVQYIGIVVMPLGWLIFTLHYTGRENWLTRKTFALLGIIPFFTLLLTFTNETHGLIWRRSMMNTDGPFSVLVNSYGIGFWVFLAYSCTLIIIADSLLIRTLMRSRRLYGWQAIALLFGLSLPWLGIGFDLAGPMRVDLSPFVFTLSSLLVVWSLFRLRLLDIVPVAREIIIEGMNDSVIVLDAKNYIVDLNPTARHLIRQSSLEAIGQPIEQVWPDWPSQMEHLHSGIHPQNRSHPEDRVYPMDGSEVRKEVTFEKGNGRLTYDVRISSLLDWRGRLANRVVVLRDVTEYKRAGEAHKESEEKYRNLVERAKDGITIIQDTLLKYVNPYFAEVMGYTTQELINTPFTDYVYPEDLAKITDYHNRRMSGEDVQQIYETAIVAKDGKKINIEVNAGLIMYGGKVADLVLIRDITERVRMEGALRESELKNRTLIESMSEGLMQVDNNDVIQFVNNQFCDIVGYSRDELLGKVGSELLLAEEDRNTVREKDHLRLQKISDRYEVRLKKKTGEIIWVQVGGAPVVDANGSLIGSIGVHTDITEQKRSEEELLKVKKLESVGILAGGIAHDFNNILTAVLGNISLAKISEDPLEVGKILTEVEKASLKAKDLTGQLLTFSKGGSLIKKTASIEEMIKDTANFALRGSNVRCDFSIPGSLGQVEVDTAQMSQVINNLIINAQQAMPEGGTIKILGENVTVGAGRTYGLPLKVGEYVKVSIEDQGVGISREHLGKIFDPYFTTKQEGSGLGLAITYSIVKNHDGYVTVGSELGVGTTFYIYLPLAHKEVSTKKEVEERPLMGNGRVLAMDDEESIRELISRILSHTGYEVHFAKDGAEAIELYKDAKESGHPFDAVIMDLTIPGGMGGKEAIKDLLEIDPKVKAIVSSGYSNDPIMTDFMEYGFSGVVAKPYRVAELSKTVDEVIKDSN